MKCTMDFPIFRVIKKYYSVNYTAKSKEIFMFYNEPMLDHY